MLGFKPNKRIWKRVNKAILGENAAEALSTILNGLSMLLLQSGVVASEQQARAHLAAMLVSPDDSPEPGSLVPMMHEELKRLNDGKWLQ